MAQQSRTVARYGGWLVMAGAAIALCIAVFDYFTASSHIDHSGGVLLVIGAMVLLLAAALVVYPDRTGVAWLRGLLKVLIVLDILGSGFAAYMLESTALLVLMAIALIGYVMGFANGRTMPATPIQENGHARVMS